MKESRIVLILWLVTIAIAIGILFYWGSNNCLDVAFMRLRLSFGGQAGLGDFVTFWAREAACGERIRIMEYPLAFFIVCFLSAMWKTIKLALKK